MSQLCTLRQFAAGLCFAAMSLGVCVSLPQAVADSGAINALASRNPTRPSPWRVMLDTSWVEGNGYRPVKVTVSPQPPLVVPTKRAYSVRVELRPYNYYWRNHGTRVAKSFDIPQGSDGATTTIHVPTDGFWQAIEIAVYVDGEELSDLSSHLGMVGNANNWTETAPTVLIIDSDAPPTGNLRLGMATATTADAEGEEAKSHLPNVGELIPAFGGFDNTSPGLITLANGTVTSLASTKITDATDDAILGFVRLSPRAIMLPPESFTEQWLTFSSCSVVFISLDDLRRMRDEHGEQFHALRRCIATGHSLCVWGVGEQFEKLKELDQILALPTLSENAPHGWTTPDPNDYQRTFPELEYSANQSTMVYPGGSATIARPAPVPNTNKKKESPNRRPPTWLRSRPLAFGKVVAMSPDNPFPGVAEDWTYLLAVIGEENWSWYRRHGMSLASNNPDFHEFAIANVGRPPIYTFLALISVFAIVIGPVNYIWLNRKRRLYLMLVTVPLGAGIVTASLLSYAVLSDGLHTRHRVRSVTYVDQKGGDVINWSRQTFFAGLAPGRGMNFPDDTAVYPLHRWWINHDSYRELEWDDNQRLVRGYLPSRTIAQFVTVRARQNPWKLKVALPNAVDAPAQATNELGTTLQLLVVCGANGKFYYGEQISDGDQAALQPIEPPAIGAKLREIMSGRNEYEVGYTAYDEQPPRAMQHYWRPTANILPSFASGVLGRNLNQWDVSRYPLAPGEFLAIVPNSPEVPVGVPKVHEEGGVHLIYGNW